MEFKYTVTREDMKKLLYKQQAKYDFLVLIFASTYYIIFSICSALLTFMWFYISYLIFLSIVWLVNRYINHLYVSYMLRLNDKVTNHAYGEALITINDNGIVQYINNQEFKMTWIDIKRVARKKDLIVLYPEFKKAKLKTICFMFYKDFFNNKKDFDKISSMINERIPLKK